MGANERGGCIYFFGGECCHAIIDGNSGSCGANEGVRSIVQEVRDVANNAYRLEMGLPILVSRPVRGVDGRWRF